MLLLSWAALTLLLSIWSLAAPPLASADEPAHVFKAITTVRGVLVGQQATVKQGARPPAEGTIYTPYILEHVPTGYARAGQIGCWAHRDTVPASCSPALTDGAPGSATVLSTSGRYSPLYYALVGGPSLALGATPAVYAMRLLSSLWCGLLLATAITVAVAQGYRWLALAVTVAVTPSAAFFGGTINPSGFEICASVCFWTVALVLATREMSVRAARWCYLALAATLVVLLPVRPLSPLWALVILAFALAFSARAQVVSLLRMRIGLLLMPLILLSGLVGVAWTFGAHALSLIPEASNKNITLHDAVIGHLDRTRTLLTGLVGQLGWNDTPISLLSLLLWVAAVGALLLAALALGRWRDRVALVVLAVSVVAIPLAIQAPEVHNVGFAWQSRYTMPLAVGLPLLAAAAVDRRRLSSAEPRMTTWWRRPTVGAALVCTGLGVAEGAAFFTALHRWAVGVDASFFRPYLTAPSWQPPLHVLPTLALAATAVLLHRCWALWLFRSGAAAEVSARSDPVAPAP